MKLKNLLIKWTVGALRPASRRLPSTPPKSILVVSTTGVGDTLWGTPALRALRTNFPESYIAVLTSPIGEEILARSKSIDEIFVLEKPHFWSLLRYLPALKKKEFDAILFFHTSQRLVLPALALLGAPIMIGTEGIQKELDFLLTKPLKKIYEHEIDRRLRMAKEIGARVNDYTLAFSIHKDEEREAQRFLEGRGIPSHLPLVGLHPGAKNSFKQWSPKCFIEVGRRLYQHMGCQIIVSGDHSEGLLVLDIASAIPGAIPLAGEMQLGPLAALLKRYTLFITNDTGPMHLAFSTKTPTVAIFGPTDPALCGPHHYPHAKVVARQKTCTPCLGKRCIEPFCLMQIGPDEVYAAALELFYHRKD